MSVTLTTRRKAPCVEVAFRAPAPVFGIEGEGNCLPCRPAGEYDKDNAIKAIVQKGWPMERTHGGDSRLLSPGIKSYLSCFSENFDYYDFKTAKQAEVIRMAAKKEKTPSCFSGAGMG